MRKKEKKGEKIKMEMIKWFFFFFFFFVYYVYFLIWQKRHGNMSKTTLY